jgi:molecular chaperone GrpE
MNNQEDNIKEDGQDTENMHNETDIKAENQSSPDENTENDNTSDAEKIKELNDKYLRLYSEFDNYRKRTQKEKIDLIKTASEEVFKAILPVIDDLDRAVKANEAVTEVEVVKEGLVLISNKLKNVVFQKGLTSFETKGEVFNPDIMEAITHIPASEESDKGKVVDEVEKGYKLGEKVIRFAKVVIAQ